MPWRVKTPVCSRDLVRRAAVHAAADAGSTRLRSSRARRSCRCPPAPRFASGEREARQQPHRPQVHVLIEALAERQDQLPAEM